MDRKSVKKLILQRYPNIDLSHTSLNDVILGLRDSDGIDLSTQKELVTEVLLEVFENDEQSISEVEEESDLRQRDSDMSRGGGGRSLGLKEYKTESKEDFTPRIVQKYKFKATKDTSVFHRPLLASDALQPIVGKEMVSRPEAVKLIWAYVRANDLQDPKDKRYILCDKTLENLFKRKRVNCFSMNKDLSRHLFKPEDLTEKAPQVDKEPEKAEKRLQLPPEWARLKILPNNATYHDIQLALLGHLKKYRSECDPELLSRPEGDLAGLIFHENEECITVSELLTRLRSSLSMEIQRVYGARK